MNNFYIKPRVLVVPFIFTYKEIQLIIFVTNLLLISKYDINKSYINRFFSKNVLIFDKEDKQDNFTTRYLV
jgi:hypothetical protein